MNCVRSSSHHCRETDQASREVGDHAYYVLGRTTETDSGLKEGFCYGFGVISPKVRARRYEAVTVGEPQLSPCPAPVAAFAGSPEKTSFRPDSATYVNDLRVALYLILPELDKSETTGACARHCATRLCVMKDGPARAPRVDGPRAASARWTGDGLRGA